MARCTSGASRPTIGTIHAPRCQQDVACHCLTTGRGDASTFLPSCRVCLWKPKRTTTSQRNARVGPLWALDCVFTERALCMCMCTGRHGTRTSSTVRADTVRNVAPTSDLLLPSHNSGDLGCRKGERLVLTGWHRANQAAGISARPRGTAAAINSHSDG